MLHKSSTVVSDEINYRLERNGAITSAFRLGRTFPGYLTEKTSFVFGIRGQDGLVLNILPARTEFRVSANGANPSLRRCTFSIGSVSNGYRF